MIQKYVLLKDTKANELIIKEFAELNKDAFTLMYEETFDDKTIKSAINKGIKALIAAIRTKNMYPTGIYATQIAEEITNLYKSQNADSMELLFDDKEMVIQEREAPEPSEESESESVEIDELLEDDISKTTYDDNELDDIIVPLKTVNSDGSDDDDEQ